MAHSKRRHLQVYTIYIYWNLFDSLKIEDITISSETTKVQTRRVLDYVCVYVLLQMKYHHSPRKAPNGRFTWKQFKFRYSSI